MVPVPMNEIYKVVTSFLVPMPISPLVYGMAYENATRHNFQIIK